MKKKLVLKSWVFNMLFGIGVVLFARILYLINYTDSICLYSAAALSLVIYILLKNGEFND